MKIHKKFWDFIFRRPSLARQILKPQKVEMSMGCKVEADRCSICGAKISWCEHTNGRIVQGPVTLTPYDYPVTGIIEEILVIKKENT